MYVVGTAGHVDHGKSTLVEALTGIDPDRLREEKVRGMTIDLGFAWLTLPGGNEVSVVDVPGHERFVNNMLAGVGGIDMALLVVAADESVMPQTREHLAILDLLGVGRGLVAITKSDLVEEEWLGLVESEVEDVLTGTTLEDAPIVAVSAMTGNGLPELKATMARLLEETPSKPDLGRPRLPVDRSFTMSGFGTVVTGTLIDGRLSVGEAVELVVSGRKARVRGLQTHRTRLEEALPGTRVAANLTGVAHEEVSRGDVMATGGWLTPATALDVRLRVLDDAPHSLRHNMFVTVHSGSSEVIGRLRLLDSRTADPGATVWAQLKLDTPVAVVKGDYVVIRSNQTTLGGGEVADPHARRHRRNHRPILQRLDSMLEGSTGEVLLRTIETSEPAEFRTLVNRANLEPEAAAADLEEMAGEGLVVFVGSRAIGPGVLVYTSAGWEAVVRDAADFLDAFHRRYPPPQRRSQGGDQKQAAHDASNVQRPPAHAGGPRHAGRRGDSRQIVRPRAERDRAAARRHRRLRQAARVRPLLAADGRGPRSRSPEPARGRETGRACQRHHRLYDGCLRADGVSHQDVPRRARRDHRRRRPGHVRGQPKVRSAADGLPGPPARHSSCR